MLNVFKKRDKSPQPESGPAVPPPAQPKRSPSPQPATMLGRFQGREGPVPIVPLHSPVQRPQGQAHPTAVPTVTLPPSDQE